MTVFTDNPGHTVLGPLPPLNVGSDCTVFCLPVNIERGMGRECSLSVGSGQGMVLYNIRHGWPKHFGRNCSNIKIENLYVD